MKRVLQVASRMFCLPLLGPLLVGAAGCGSGSTYPVQGKVVFKDGTPLAGGYIVFESVDDDRVIARSDIEPDGTFTLGTRKPGDGALAGQHRVAVSPPLRPNPEAAQGPPLIHPRFAKAGTSNLVFTVERRANHFTIEVEKP
jgi:hypothetical protein